MKYSHSILLSIILLASPLFCKAASPNFAPCDMNTISVDSSPNICKDGIADILTPKNSIDGSIGTDYSYFITDNSGIIVVWDTLATFFDADLLSEGAYMLYGVSYSGTLSGGIGTSIGDIAVVETAGCLTISSGPFTFTVSEAPSVAFAGADISVCGTSTVDLAADFALFGQGIWTQISGDTLAQIADTTLNNTSVTNLSAGLYEFEWAVSNGACPPSIDTVAVRISTSSVTIDSIYIRNETCHNTEDGTIAIEVSNTDAPTTFTVDGVSIISNNNTEVFGPFSAGTYAITLSDASGCFITDSVTVLQPDSLTVSHITVNESDVNAMDGMASFCVNGGTLPYNTPVAVPNTPIGALTMGACDGNYEMNQLSGGTYYVSFTDANNCAVADTITIAAGECTTQIDTVIIEELACAGDANSLLSLQASGTNDFQFSIDGGLTYSPFLGGPFYAQGGLSSGNYEVIVRDTVGCSDTINVSIAEPTAVDISQIMTTNVSQVGVNDGQIDFCINGGTPPYSVVYSGQNTGVSDTIMLPNGSNCMGDFSENGLGVDTYDFTIIDSLGCTITQPIDLVIDCSSFSINIVEAEDLVCFEDNAGQILVGTTGGVAPFTYILNDGTSSDTIISNQMTTMFDSLVVGAYTIEVIHAGGCQTSFSSVININQPTALTMNTEVSDPSSVGGLDGEICISPIGGTPPYINVTASCGTIFAGSGTCGGSYRVSNLSAGACDISVTDANGCTYSETLNLIEPSCTAFTVTSTEAIDISCANEDTGIIHLSIEGGVPPFLYSINGVTTTDVNPEISFLGLAAGDYDISILDQQNCVLNLSQITINQPTELAVSTEAMATCPDAADGGIDVTTSGGTMPYTYFWDNQSMDEDIDQLASGTYSLTLTDANACTEIITTTINEYPTIEVDAGADVVVDAGTSVNLNATISANTGSTFVWSPSTWLSDSLSLSPVATPPVTTTYTLTVISEDGCIFTDEVRITANALRDVIAVPSAFSPNGDTNNDILYVYFQGDIEVQEFLIFNRWGENIFTTTVPTEGWDGTYNGKEQPLGTYVYLVRYTNESGSVETLGGDVTLVR